MMALMLVAACLASYGGFACLALAMPEHWEPWRGRSQRAVPWRWLRPAGLGLLALAYGLCVRRDGISFGSLLWTVLISAAALAVAFTLTWRATR